MLRSRAKFIEKSLRCFNPNVIQPPPWNLAELRDNWRDPDFPVKELQHFTEHDNQEKRQKLRELLADDTFLPGELNFFVLNFLILNFFWFGLFLF